MHHPGRFFAVTSSAIWLLIGIAGQVLFSLRFLLQWLYSELKRRSVFPMAFWYLSIVGGSLLLAYAIWRRDPVFIIGQGGGLAVYLRNLQWRLRERRNAASATPPQARES